MNSVAFTNIGKRQKNEDAFYESENLFIVCDGVGGMPYGEVASKLACTSFADYFKQNIATVLNGAYLRQALNYTIAEFKNIESKYPETKGMATTIALLAFDTNCATIAWLGDSRLYHVRNGQIVFVTQDHSLLNKLAPKGEDVSNINKNIITKWLDAKTETEFSIHQIAQSEILTDDLFFICTDGVLENIDEAKINHIFLSSYSVAEIEQKIIMECEARTNDNYTFVILKIEHP